ncbi:unnamed protein product [Trifolium pratense]|uniref:Uncharacterized protein n=1 Tax=Trifolium pratense TaxID=57577 RepID=A0ACB0KPV3_TRIPR|nr:unnamed protein product [Trifolium pratense]
MAIREIGKKTPGAWWESYGNEYPELQKFAICVLSLTCSSSGCERNLSAFEMVHTKRRNRLKQETMNDVFVMANAKLAQKQQFRRPPQELHLGDVSSTDEWIVEENGTPNDDVNVIEDDIDDVPPLEKIEEYLKNLDGT